jgi:hypothetical protein
MSSPYVRQLRLGRELETLMKAAGLTHQSLANKVGWSRSKVTRLLNGEGAREGDVLNVLRALEVKGEQYSQLRAIARDAAHRGWWDRNEAAMGRGQAQAANLESGAATIREYHMTYVPGLLQTVEYMRSIFDTDDLTTPTTNGVGMDPDKMVEARLNRQEMLRAPDGPQYEVIIDELMVRRRTASLEILAAQLRYLAEPGERITVQVLPVGADIDAFSVPRGSFSLYTYHDQRDGTIATVDAFVEETVVTESSDVRRLEILYDRIRQAALPGHESARLLSEAADNMMEGIMS